MATASTDGAQQATTTQEDGTTAQSIVNMHRYKMQPPEFTGEYGTFEEWKYKFQAYMGLMDNTLPQLLENAENSTTIIRDADLVAAASATEEANKWKVEATDLRYILINICSGAAATTCRQHQSQNGFEIYRQLCVRLSIPLGTRLIGYLTILLKPTFDMNNFEETFSQWDHYPLTDPFRGRGQKCKLQVVPGRAGGGSFRRKKNYIAKKEFAYIMCAGRPTSAMPKPFLCCERAFCCSMVVM